MVVLNRWWSFGLLAVLGGCGKGDIEAPGASEGPVATSEDGLGVSCANAEALATYFFGPFEFVSPRTYNPPDCFKGQVIDLDQAMPGGRAGLDPPPGATGGRAGLDPPPPPPSNSGVPPSELVDVSWADTSVFTQTECEASVVRGYLFRISPETTETVEVRSKTGEWTSLGCVMPVLRFDPLAPYSKYRIAVNARTGPSSGAATRKVRVQGQPAL